MDEPEDPASDSPHKVDRIIAAARRVALRHGTNAISVRGVAREAGLSLGAITHYFRSRTELLESLLDRHHSVVGEVLRELLSGADTVAARRRAIRGLLAYAFDHRTDVRLRLASWTASWELPRARMLLVERTLARVAKPEWPSDFDLTERRILVQAFVYAVQHFAALSDDELGAIVGPESRHEATDRVAAAIEKAAFALVGSPDEHD